MSDKLKNFLVTKSMSKLYLDAESSDLKFKFKSGDETLIVPAHKVILASASTVFYTEFFGPLKGKETIEITDASAEAFKQFLQLFYLSEVTMTVENIADVLHLAQKYDMLEHLLKKLELSMANVLKSDAFRDCDRQILKHILQIDRMFVDEIDIFNVCIEWAKSSCRRNGLDENSAKTLRKQIGDCFRLIRFGTMTKTNIEAITLNEQYTGLFEPDELDDIVRMSNDKNFKSTIFNQNSRVRLFLEKLIAGSCESMFEQLQHLKIGSEEKFACLASLIFERAINQPNFSSSCAQLCRKLSESVEECEFRCKERKETLGTVFKRELRNKCQTELNKLMHAAHEDPIEDTVRPNQQNLDEATSDFETEIVDGWICQRKRHESEELRPLSVRTIRFIGELYRQDLIHTNVMQWCIETLLKMGTDEKLECLCELLTTIGGKMERKTNDEEYDKKYYRDLTCYFETLDEFVEKFDWDDDQWFPRCETSDRVQSMIEKLIELRMNDWQPRRSFPSFARSHSDSESFDSIEKLMKSLLEKVQRGEIHEYNDLSDALQPDNINCAHRWTLVRGLHNLAVDVTGFNDAKRWFIGTICTYWLDQQQITKQDYVRGLTEYVKTLADVVIDVPKIYEWTAQMISVPLFSAVVSLTDLKKMAKESRGKILAILLPFMAYEYGPHYVRNLWKQSGCKWDQFDTNVDQFLERNNLRFVENLQEKLPPANKQLPEGRLIARIRHLIWDEKVFETEVVEYVNLHVPTINKQSVRSLTKVLIEVALLHNKIQEKQLIRSINVLNEYIGGELKKDLQLESLYAIQLLSNELEHPSGFLHAVFSQLHDSKVVAAEVFKNWEKSVDEPLGKGIAVKNLTHFLKEKLGNIEAEYEEDYEQILN